MQNVSAKAGSFSRAQPSLFYICLFDLSLACDDLLTLALIAHTRQPFQRISGMCSTPRKVIYIPQFPIHSVTPSITLTSSYHQIRVVKMHSQSNPTPKHDRTIKGIHQTFNRIEALEGLLAASYNDILTHLGNLYLEYNKVLCLLYKLPPSLAQGDVVRGLLTGRGGATSSIGTVQNDISNVKDAISLLRSHVWEIVVREEASRSHTKLDRSSCKERARTTKSADEDTLGEKWNEKGT